MFSYFYCLLITRLSNRAENKNQKILGCDKVFTFYRIGFEPEMYLEDYGIYYADTNEPFITNDYYNDEGYDMSIVPVVSINREGHAVELFDFAYDDVLPSDKPKLIKAIMELVELKEQLNIVDYVVIGEGAPLYYKLFNKKII